MSYDLGAAKGSIEIGYDGKGVEQAKSALGSLKSGASNLASSVVGSFGVAAGAVTAFGSAVAGIAIAGGIARQLKIEDAQAKLRGLGNDAESVEAIMNSALESVEGTAYGLDTAATVAATAVAAGIKPGQELTNYLKLTADAATIAGTSMEEMGSIINKTTTSGMVFTDNLNQLADRGIPIFTWLQDEYGVTASELRDMVSRGEVDSETFRRVIEQNIGGAALESGNTTRGAYKNMIAALSRTGQALMRGVFPYFNDFFNNIRTGLNALNKTIGPVFDKIGASVGKSLVAISEVIANAMASIDISAIADAFSRIGPFIAPIAGLLVGMLGPLLSQIPLIGQLFAGLTGPVGLAVGAIIGLMGIFPGLRTAASDGVGGIVDALPRIIEVAQSVFTQALGAVTDFVGGFIDGFGGVDNAVSGFQTILTLLNIPLAILRDALLQVFSGAGGIDFAAFGETAGATLRPFMDLLGQIATVIVGELSGALATIIPVFFELVAAVAPLVAQLVAQLLPVILELAQGVLPIFMGLLQTILPVFVNLVSAIAPLVAQLLSGLLPVLMTLITSALPIVQSAFEQLAPVIGTLFEAIGPLISLMASTLVPALLALINLLVPVLIPAFAAVAAVIVGAVQGAITGVTMVINGLRNILQGVIDFVTGVFSGNWRQVWEGIKSIVTGVIQVIGGAIWTWLNVTVLGAVRRGIAGLLSVFTGGWGNITRVFSGATGAIRNVVSSFITAVRNFISNFMSGASSIISNGVKVWQSAFGGALNAIRTVVSQAFSAVVNFVRSGLSSAVGAVRTGLSNMRSAVSSGITNTINFFRNLPSRILGALGNLGSLLRNAGGQIINGLIAGITGAVDRAVSAVKNAVGSVIGGAKKALGISSPSKVFTVIGEQTGEGLEIGLQRSIAGVAAAAADMADSVVRNGQPGPLTPSINTASSRSNAFAQQQANAGAGPGASTRQDITQHITLQIPDWVFGGDGARLIEWLKSLDLLAHYEGATP